MFIIIIVASCINCIICNKLSMSTYEKKSFLTLMIVMTFLIKMIEIFVIIVICSSATRIDKVRTLGVQLLSPKCIIILQRSFDVQ